MPMSPWQDLGWKQNSLNNQWAVLPGKTYLIIYPIYQLIAFKSLPNGNSLIAHMRC